MYRIAQPGEFEALARLFAASFGGGEPFARQVLAEFAGPGNVFAAGEGGADGLLCAVPVTLTGRPGAYYYGLTTRPEARGRGLMTGLMEYAGQELARRGCAFAALIPAGEELFGFYRRRGFEEAFSKRVIRRAIPANLWAAAEFDTVTAHGLEELRQRWAPEAVALRAEGTRMVLTDLYSLGVTSVCTPHGYGLYFKKGEALRFVELFADSDRAAGTILEAARQKCGATEAVVELGAAQDLFLGEGQPKPYGMIRFFGPRFDVESAYMRLMLDDE